MAAYVIAFVEMLDEKVFRDYQGVAGSAFGAYDAKFLTRGGDHKVLEGPAEDRTCVLVEFPSMEKAEAFWNSPEYQAAIKMREGAANMQVLLIPGGD